VSNRFSKQPLMIGGAHVALRVSADGAAHGPDIVPETDHVLTFDGARTMKLEPANETTRQAVNKWIRETRRFDAVLDFEKVVQDPQNPLRIRKELTGDYVHPNTQGYRLMAEAVALDLFEQPSPSRWKHRQPIIFRPDGIIANDTIRNYRHGGIQAKGQSRFLQLRQPRAWGSGGQDGRRRAQAGWCQELLLRIHGINTRMADLAAEL
jgi:hypothetical protein